MISIGIMIHNRYVGYVEITNIDDAPNGKFGSGELRKYRIEGWTRHIDESLREIRINATITRDVDPLRFARDALVAVYETTNEEGTRS